MKKIICAVMLALCSVCSYAQQTNPLVGVWQKIDNMNQTHIMVGPNGKVFLPDGRLFGFYLNPTDFAHYDEYNFGPWIFGSYEVTSDSTYTERIILHEAGPTWETQAYFKYAFVGKRILVGQFDHTFPDGTVRTIYDIWIKAVYDDKEREAIIKKVYDNWDQYLERAKTLFGRE